MDDPSGSAPLPWWTWPWQMMGLAPRTLHQPVLPGWIFANTVSVTDQNSSAPDTEREIVAVHSYGRQLGRLMDAVAALIEERPQGSPAKAAFEDFEKLRSKVEEIKAEAAAKRIEHLRADLAALRRKDPDEYQRAVAELRKALED